MSQSDSLASIYEHVQCALEGLGCACAACGRCCDFAANDYILYASAMEIELVSAKTGRWPELIGGRCCFQDSAGRCTIHQWRPLGCRTYFCDRVQGGASGAVRCAEVYEQALARLRKLAQECGGQWSYRRFFG